MRKPFSYALQVISGNTKTLIFELDQNIGYMMDMVAFDIPIFYSLLDKMQFTITI